MTTRRIAILIAFCLVVAVASAEEYSVRANRGLNLRTGPSLDADIADTVRSGTILQVVGKFNRWLKISYNGSEVWLADWVDFSRVNESAPAPNPQLVSSAPANVDNCCFVDRQCQSDQEWINGYWAFQNNQCLSATQSPAPALSRPLIEGSDVFARQIGATLDLLQNTAPEWYDYVISGMDRIVEVPSLSDNPSSCIGRAHSPGKMVSAHTGCTFASTTCWSQRMWWVGLLAHEACHIHTYESGIDFAAMGLDEEIECGKIGYAASLAVNPAWTRSVVKYNLNATRVSLGQSIIVPTC